MYFYGDITVIIFFTIGEVWSDFGHGTKASGSTTYFAGQVATIRSTAALCRFWRCRWTTRRYLHRRIGYNEKYVTLNFIFRVIWTVLWTSEIWGSFNLEMGALEIKKKNAKRFINVGLRDQFLKILDYPNLRQGPALEGRNSPLFAKRFWKGNK